MIAGRDTTAAGMSWTMYELLQNPQHIRLIRDELQSYLDANHSGVQFTELSHEDMFTVVETGLPYLRAVVLEGLRMHPSVMKDFKFCVEDDVLPDGTVVKKGQAVFYAPYVLCRNPHVWESPDEFKPERFLAKVGGTHRLSNADNASGEAATTSLHKPANVSDFEYPVFNAGTSSLRFSRSCSMFVLFSTLFQQETRAVFV
jgi:cytochrome P450